MPQFCCLSVVPVTSVPTVTGLHLSSQPHQEPAAAEDRSGLRDEDGFHQQHPEVRVSHHPHESRVRFQASPAGESSGGGFQEGPDPESRDQGRGESPLTPACGHRLSSGLGSALSRLSLPCCVSSIPCATGQRDSETPGPDPQGRSQASLGRTGPAGRRGWGLEASCWPRLQTGITGDGYLLCHTLHFVETASLSTLYCPSCPLAACTREAH